MNYIFIETAATKNNNIGSSMRFFDTDGFYNILSGKKDLNSKAYDYDLKMRFAQIGGYSELTKKMNLEQFEEIFKGYDLSDLDVDFVDTHFTKDIVAKYGTKGRIKSGAFLSKKSLKPFHKYEGWTKQNKENIIFYYLGKVNIKATDTHDRECDLFITEKEYEIFIENANNPDVYLTVPYFRYSYNDDVKNLKIIKELGPFEFSENELTYHNTEKGSELKDKWLFNPGDTATYQFLDVK